MRPPVTDLILIFYIEKYLHLKNQSILLQNLLEGDGHLEKFYCYLFKDMVHTNVWAL